MRMRKRYGINPRSSKLALRRRRSPTAVREKARFDRERRRQKKSKQSWLLERLRNQKEYADAIDLAMSLKGGRYVSK